MIRRRRRGIVLKTLIGGGLINAGRREYAVYEVLELERAGEYVRVRVIDVTGVTNKDQARKLFAEWLPDSDIRWIDG